MPRTLSHYRLDGELGRGGMGVVYRATDTRLGRAVAIKTLSTEATGDPDRHRRFIQEARSASILNHPHIVTIYDVGEEAGETFVAMELVEGVSLDVELAKGPLPVSRALDYAVQVASALEAAHAAGMVHRDVKPANLMVTSDGRVKVLDFGLAKLVERGGADTTMTALGTQPGMILGTAAYMSPEQAEGRPVDARSDLFSFGAVLYEMFAGRRAFAGDSDVGLLTAILRDQPPPIREARADVPAELEAIVERCLAKHPASRYQDAGALRAALTRVLAASARPADTNWRRPLVLAPLTLLLLAAAALGAWQFVQSRRAAWARQDAIPEIERLQVTDRSLDALRLAREAARYASEDVERLRQTWFPVTVETEPGGASVEIRNYVDLEGPWEPFGPSPVTERLPLGYYRLRLSHPGYVTLEVGHNFGGRSPIALVSEASAEPGMVFVAGGAYRYLAMPPAHLPDFWIDRREVTNAEFQRFVDAGGYRNPDYWKVPFRDGGRDVPFEEAMARFLDTTGRPGPATWELGTFPEGHGSYPVGGLSWFEAAAFAAFAGKRLPTVYHWYKAAGVDELFGDILRLSNFDGRGARPVGERHAVGPWGALDMAGNVKEWCANEVGDSGLRYILGGGWHEPAYRFNESDARSPWDREPSFGVRLVRNLGPDADAAGPITVVNHDPASIVPLPSAQVDLLQRFYEYDKAPLDARVEAVDDRSEHWRMETVSFNAAYGGERVPAYLFLPKHAAPPYHTVLLFPSSYSLRVDSSRHLDYGSFDYIVRSGRAVLYPIYQGTFERRRPDPPGWSAIRDRQVQWAKDLFRSVDYLETRSDLTLDGLTYYSISMGAFFGPIPISLEPRIASAVLIAGGLRHGDIPPEIQPANFVPRVTVPVLLVHGRHDFSAPPAAQQRVLDLLGTSPQHKRLVVLDGGHAPSDTRGMFRAVLDWLDTYQGPPTPGERP